MLRRPPTAISLSKRDVEEHLEHISQQKIHERENIQPPQDRRLPSPLSPRVRAVSPGDHYYNGDWEEIITHTTTHNINFGPFAHRGYPQPDVKSPSSASRDSYRTDQDESVPRESLTDKVSSTQILSLLDKNEGNIETHVNSEDEEGFIPAGFADPSGQTKEPPVRCDYAYSGQQSSASRHAFDYGGFVEAAVEESSSFAPEDISTPRYIDLFDVQRLSLGVPLPRSPLFRSYGANFPERRPTSSLTPRLASYGTPGLLLSQPAQRPRAYRPRTISYSFEESERASAAYEEVQASDSDSNGCQLPRVKRRSLHEELHGTSSHTTVSLGSDVPSSPPYVSDNQRSASSANRAEQVAEQERIFCSSSPRLPLPPPFSAVPRNVSLVASRPSPSEDEGRLGSSSASPPRSSVRGLQASPVVESSSQGASSGILRSLSTLPLRLYSAYRSRSPIQSRPSASRSGSASPRPRRRSQGRTPACIRPPTPGRHFQIYDDRVPASLQPQTPQHLPEARHQSRFHPSYTAPAVLRREGPRGRQPGRHWGTRSDSPAGVNTPGFRGLYGGQENTDDEVMFERAAQRLWALSSARRSGRSMSNTPDREVSFADDRGDYR